MLRRGYTTGDLQFGCKFFAPQVIRDIVLTICCWTSCLAGAGHGTDFWLMWDWLNQKLFVPVCRAIYLHISVILGIGYVTSPAFPSPLTPKVHKALPVGWNASKRYCSALPRQQHCPPGVTGWSHLEDSFHESENQLFRWRLSDMNLLCNPREVWQPPSPRSQGQQQFPKPTSTAACQDQAATHVGQKSSWLCLANTHLQPVAREDPCLFAEAAHSGACSSLSLLLFS